MKKLTRIKTHYNWHGIPDYMPACGTYSHATSDSLRHVTCKKCLAYGKRRAAKTRKPQDPKGGKP